MFAAQQRLDNLIAIIDYNKLQAMDYLDKIVALDPLADKWRAFGWEVREVDGHDLKLLIPLLRTTPFVNGRPNLVVAHTTEGKGVSYMENMPIWHYRLPNADETRIACKELGVDDFWGENQ